jgi:hypothetical protein
LLQTDKPFRLNTPRERLAPADLKVSHIRADPATGIRSPLQDLPEMNRQDAKDAKKCGEKRWFFSLSSWRFWRLGGSKDHS